MIRIALYGNKRQRGDTAPLQTLINQLASHHPQVTCSVQTDFMAFMQRSFDMPHVITDTFDTADPTADLALSIGGDGTFLKTAWRIGPLQTPIMGINSGHLGYMSAADITEAPAIIDDILAGRYRIEHRSVIEVHAPDAMLPHNQYALNEVAVLKKDTASMIRVEAHIDSWPAAAYRADGLIVSTPTGSTGYNLSVGGPIVAPSARIWTIAPVAPHSLNMRPLAVCDDSIIEILAESRADTYLLSIDGKSVSMPSGSTLRLSKAPHCVNIVLRPSSNFIDTLREKLLWGIDGI